MAGETPNDLNGGCTSDLAKSCEVNGEAVKHQVGYFLFELVEYLGIIYRNHQLVVSDSNANVKYLNDIVAFIL